MRNILIPIDADHPARTRNAIEQAVRLYRDEPSALHLLRVRPAVSNHVSMYFGSQELQGLLQEWGAEELQPAQRLLQTAGVPFTSTVRVGQTARTIAAVARELHCDRIVFGAEDPGLAERLFGSLAQQVRQLLGGQGDPQVIGG